MSVINSFTQHTINLTRKALRLGSDFVHPVHDDTPDEPDYLSNADVPVETNIALPHSDDWDDGHLTVTDIDPATGLLTTSTEGNPPLDEGTSIYDLYADRAERMGDEPLYTYKSGNDWVTVTANEFLADVRAVAKGLIHYGLKKGDAVAFMCRTSYDWDLTDAAIMACGGVLATIYDTDSAEQIRNIVNNSDARLLIVQDTDMRKKADGAVEECPSLEHIITIETGGLDEIKAYGTTVSDEELDERIDSVKKTDLCSIVYTSGSTAAPKGVEMTHEHYCQTALNLPAYMPDLLHDKRNTILLFLPQAHSFARAINYIVVSSNVRIYIATGIKTLIIVMGGSAKGLGEAGIDEKGGADLFADLDAGLGGQVDHAHAAGLDRAVLTRNDFDAQRFIGLAAHGAATARIKQIVARRVVDIRPQNRAQPRPPRQREAVVFAKTVIDSAFGQNLRAGPGFILKAQERHQPALQGITLVGVGLVVAHVQRQRHGQGDQPEIRHTGIVLGPQRPVLQFDIGGEFVAGNIGQTKAELGIFQVVIVLGIDSVHDIALCAVERVRADRLGWRHDDRILSRRGVVGIVAGRQAERCRARERTQHIAQ